MIKLAILGLNADGSVDENRRFWIAGDPVRSQALHTGFEAETRSITRGNQKVAGAGFKFQTPLDTGNETFTESFRTTLTFEGTDGALNAWQWCNSFSRLDPTLWPHPIQGDFIARFEKVDGSFVDERLYNGLITKPTINRTGGTVELSYQLTGGRIEAYHTGSVVKPVTLMPSDSTVQMRFFGEAAGGDFTDAATSISGSVSGSLAVGSLFEIQGVDNISAASLTITFEVVSPGTLPTPGRDPVDYPVEDNLGDVVAAFATEITMTAELISDTRPYVLITWLPAAAGALDECRITTTVSSGDYEGTTDGTDVPPVLTTPMDDNGNIPTADLLT